MSPTSPILSPAHFLLGILLAVQPAAGATADPSAGGPPPFAAIKAEVEKHFAALGYEKLDLIRSSTVKPLFQKLAARGWDVEQKKEIIGRVPRDSDFVVRQLSSPAGRKFMRQIARYPGGYDRLYQLASIRDGSGRRMIQTLVRAKGGHEMIDYMTRGKGDANAQKILGRTSRGVNFKRPVGLLFTRDALLAELETRYKAQFSAAVGPTR